MNFDVNFGMEYRGGGSVQADWSQNDPAAKDYVKNRPGGYDVVTPAKEITWDGNIEGRTVVIDGSYVFALVSDDVFTLEQLAGGEFALTVGEDEQTITIPEDDPGSVFTEMAEGVLGCEIMMIVSAPGATLDPMTFPAAGVYFVCVDNKGTLNYASKLAVKERIGAVKIPAKYLDAPSPDDVAEAKAAAEAAQTTAEAAQTTAEAAQTTAEAGARYAGLPLFKVAYRLDYSWNGSTGSLPTFTDSNSGRYYKIADVPQTLTEDSPIISYKTTLSSGGGLENYDVGIYPNGVYDLGHAIILLKAGTHAVWGTTISGSRFRITFTAPEPGIYFLYNSNESYCKLLQGEYGGNYGYFTGLILKSSTSGSKKHFKITVDDSGALTATEAWT